MFIRNHLALCVATVAVSCRDKLLMQNLIFLLVKTIFDFLARRSSFSVQWERISRRMVHSGQWTRIFRLVQTISFFPSSGNVFFNESFIPAIRGFSLYWKPSTLFESSFLLAKTVIDMSGNHFLKTNLILASGNSFSSQWKPFLPLPQMFFKKFFIPASGNKFFSPEEKVFLLRTFFPAIGNHDLNYREAYLRILSLLLATVFFDFSDVSATVSSFFVQQKCILKQILHSCQWKPIKAFFHLP